MLFGVIIFLSSHRVIANRNDMITILWALYRAKGMSLMRCSKHPSTSEIQVKQPIWACYFLSFPSQPAERGKMGPWHKDPILYGPHLLSSLAGGLSFDPFWEIKGWEWRFGQFLWALSFLPRSISGTTGSLYDHSSHWVTLLCSFVSHCVPVTWFLLLVPSVSRR